MQIWYGPFCPLYISSQYWRTINNLIILSCNEHIFDCVQGMYNVYIMILNITALLTGADPGFQVRGGGALKINCAERREARTFLGYFV
jgi:hypothetical protein